MSLEAQEIADEIVKLEKMQADGLAEYEYMKVEVLTKPIGPRLRELHKLLQETGKAPVERDHQPNPSAIPQWKTR